MKHLREIWRRQGKCCPPPPAVSGVTAVSAGGSGEAQVTWDPLPSAQKVTHYRVHLQRGTGTRFHLADVTNDALGMLEPGRLGLIDAPDYWPWPTNGVGDSRCYVITAVGNGLEGAPSAPVCVTGL